MSWLVAVCFPGLLMVFTVGLQRLESLLHGDRPSAVELVARVERAARSARQRAAQCALSELAAAPLPRRLDPVPLIDEPGLPTRPNRLFQPSGLGNRV
jgi:hypothetical protein